MDPAFSVSCVAELSSWLMDWPSSSSAFSAVPPVSRMISLISSSWRRFSSAANARSTAKRVLASVSAHAGCACLAAATARLTCAVDALP